MFYFMIILTVIFHLLLIFIFYISFTWLITVYSYSHVYLFYTFHFFTFFSYIYLYILLIFIWHIYILFYNHCFIIFIIIVQLSVFLLSLSMMILISHCIKHSYYVLLNLYIYQPLHCHFCYSYIKILPHNIYWFLLNFMFLKINLLLLCMFTTVIYKHFTFIISDSFC